MSFLDNVKAGNMTGANPFGGIKENNNNPFSKAPVSNTVTTTTPVQSAAPATPVGAPPIGMPRPTGMPTPGAIPTTTMPSPVATPVTSTPSAEPTKVEKVTPVAEQNTETVLEQANVAQAEEKKVAAPSFLEKVAQTVSEKKEEVQAEGISTEKIVQDIAKVDNEVLQTEKEEVAEKKEEAPKKKTTRKSTSRSKKKEVEPAVSEENEEALINALFTFPKSSISYVEAVQIMNNKHVDEEWEKYRASLIEESDSIVIESDMTEGALKKTISQLNTLREKVWVAFNDIKNLYTTLSNKDTEGIIERIKYANYEGTNETARKKAGVLAVMNYKDENGNIINYYEIYDETKKRFTFLKSVMDTIQFKSDILITMSTGIKLEKGQTYRQ